MLASMYGEFPYKTKVCLAVGAIETDAPQLELGNGTTKRALAASGNPQRKTFHLRRISSVGGIDTARRPSLRGHGGNSSICWHFLTVFVLLGRPGASGSTSASIGSRRRSACGAAQSLQILREPRCGLVSAAVSGLETLPERVCSLQVVQCA